MPRNSVVFVIDDDSAVLKSLKFYLEVEGFEVRCYSDGNKFLSEGDLPASGCIVIDHNLPETTGVEVLNTLRDRGVALPTILITSNVTPILRQRAADVGAHIVEKPFLGDNLIAAIRAAFSQTEGTLFDMRASFPAHAVATSAPTMPL